jgi:DNA-binding CsgD family transcriptional regulator
MHGIAYQMRLKPSYRTLLPFASSPMPGSRILFRSGSKQLLRLRRRFPMRKIIGLPFPQGRLSGRDARSGYGRSAQSSCLVSETLTARERDILTMISQGLSNKRIARAREISPETVKSHAKHIFLKLEVSTRAQAVSRAGSLGLLPYGEPTPTASHDKCNGSVLVWYRRSTSTE